MTATRLAHDGRDQAAEVELLAGILAREGERDQVVDHGDPGTRQRGTPSGSVLSSTPGRSRPTRARSAV
jgi:hypothetical protein